MAVNVFYLCGCFCTFSQFSPSLIWDELDFTLSEDTVCLPRRPCTGAAIKPRRKQQRHDSRAEISVFSVNGQHSHCTRIRYHQKTIKESLSVEQNESTLPFWLCVFVCVCLRLYFVKCETGNYCRFLWSHISKLQHFVVSSILPPLRLHHIKASCIKQWNMCKTLLIYVRLQNSHKSTGK